MPKEIFGFAENQEKNTYGWGYKLTITRKNDVALLDQAPGIADAINKFDLIHWYLPHYTPSYQ